jgi:hypothetical protein
MRRIIQKAFVPVFLLGISQYGYGQALTYTDCLVHDVPSLEAAISSFYDTLDDTVKPVIYLDEWLWNGEFDVTHRVVVAYPDYAALEALRGSIGDNPAPWLVASESIQHAADCRTDGLSVMRGAWGDQETQAVYWQVYGISTSDSAGYAAALADLSEAQEEEAAGPVLLFENRAGISGDTHLVVLGAPTLTRLNEYLDQLFASDDFADFQDEVGDDRRLTWRAQARRMRTWAP